MQCIKTRVHQLFHQVVCECFNIDCQLLSVILLLCRYLLQMLQCCFRACSVYTQGNPVTDKMIWQNLNGKAVTFLLMVGKNEFDAKWQVSAQINTYQHDHSVRFSLQNKVERDQLKPHWDLDSVHSTVCPVWASVCKYSPPQGYKTEIIFFVSHRPRVPVNIYARVITCWGWIKQTNTYCAF